MRFLPVFSFGAVYAAAAKAVRREKMRARHFTNFALSAKLYGIFAERKATGMDSYEALAASYDELTEDVEYEKRADFVEKLFLRAKRPVRSLLDLACGTGTMTELFARRGYTVTGVDYSPEMLAQAQQKLAAINSPPLLLCQSMPQLRLLDSVDAAICCLDSINYLTRPRDDVLPGHGTRHASSSRSAAVSVAARGASSVAQFSRSYAASSSRTSVRSSE